MKILQVYIVASFAAYFALADNYDDFAAYLNLPPENCYHDSYLYGSEDTVSSTFKADTTPLACKAYCQTLSGVTLWQFLYTNGNTSLSDGCYCFDAATTVYRTVPDGVTLINGLIDASDCFYDSYSYPTAVGHNQYIAEPRQCKAFCQTIPGATNYEWLQPAYTAKIKPFWRGCYCKSNLVAKVANTAKTTNWGIGGSVSASPAAVVPEGCYTTGKDYVGNDIAGAMTMTATAQVCQENCQKEPTCTAFTWLSNWHCWLKTGTPVLTDNADATTGPRYCDDCYYDSWIAGTSWTTPSNAMSTPVKCRAACTTTPGMSLWQFIYPGSTDATTGCYCYDKATTEYGSLPADVRLVGGLTEASDCFFDDYEYTRAVGHNQYINQPLQCQAFCETIPGATNYQCLLPAYTAKTKNAFWDGCYCMSNLEATKANNKTWGIGGNVFGAPPAPVIPAGCFKVGYNYGGNDISSTAILTANAQVCQSKCQELSTCTYFTWDSSWHCWLKSGEPTLAPLSGSTSGPAVCSG